MIIAPGAALNTLSDPGTPTAGCSKVNQRADRYALPFDAANFLECGNAGTNYSNPGSSNWTNDRVIAITAADVMDAIAGSGGGPAATAGGARAAGLVPAIP